MGLLFDTSAVIGLFERHDPVLRSLVAQTSTAIAVSTLTLGELETGARRVPGPVRETTLTMAYTAMIHVDVDGAVGPSCCGFIDASTSRRVGTVDAWIATSAVLGGHELVTQDAELERGLAAIDWESGGWTAPTVQLVPITDVGARS